jgi:DNA polymerase I-like protein with 3'-5' exonuclease and polymerase domains
MRRYITLLTICTVILFITTGTLQAMPGKTDFTALEKKVASLQLGFENYYIAHKLTGDQKEEAQKHLLEKSYPGTYTFTDGVIHILTAKENDTIIAVYLKNEEADKTDLKQMVADLMMQFGDPTSEAHEQIIYWAYNEKGKISEDEYAAAKKEGELRVIATVKFKSKLTFSEAAGDEPAENSIYCIISSPRLLERFYNQN